MTEEAWGRPPSPDVSQVVTENDEPVDDLQSEKGQRLLVGALYASWAGPPPLPEEAPCIEPRSFLAAANVGLFFSPKARPIVPDVMVGTDLAPRLGEPEQQRAPLLVRLGAGQGARAGHRAGLQPRGR